MTNAQALADVRESLRGALLILDPPFGAEMDAEACAEAASKLLEVALRHVRRLELTEIIAADPTPAG